MTKELPPELQVTSNRVVELFYKGDCEPAGLEFIKDWLQVEGWDYLVENWENVYLDLSYIELSDNGIYYNSDYTDSLEDIDNDMRIKYSRSKIDKEFSGEGGHAYSTAPISTYEIIGSEGKSIILGCLLDSEPGGASASWIGLFDSKDSLYNHLRRGGGLIDMDVPGLTDEMIIKMWESPITS